MKGTFGITREEGGYWEKAERGNLVHSIWFDDGSQWDAVNGWRERVRPVTFADRVNLIITEANQKFDHLAAALRTESDLLRMGPGRVIRSEWR